MSARIVQKLYNQNFFDYGPSNRMVGYISITAHFIDEEWQPQKRIVKFTAIESPHTGVVMFNTMVYSKNTSY
jgi:hypothetical protein